MPKIEGVDTTQDRIERCIKEAPSFCTIGT